MKKYWKTIVTAAVAIVSIGTFYTASAMSAVDLPEFVIKKQSGDASLVKSVDIQGNYSRGPVYKSLHITTTGSEYDSERSYLDQLIGGPPPFKEQLIMEHRAFMRGKNGGIPSFYEGKFFLVYADVSYHTTALSPTDFKLAISILNKEKKDTTSYKLSIPHGSDFDIIYVEDVQIMNGKLKVITHNRKNSESEIHIYTVNMATKKLIADDKILSSPKVKGDGFSDINLLNESRFMRSQKMIVFDKMIAQGGVPEKHSLISYNLATKKKKKIVLPKELDKATLNQEEGPSIQAFDGSVLYFMETSKNEVKIIPYHLVSEKIGEVITVQFPEVKDEAGHPLVKIVNEKLYTLSPYSKKKSAAILTVIDLKSGDPVYQGKVVEKNPTLDENQYGLFLYSMRVE